MLNRRHFLATLSATALSVSAIPLQAAEFESGKHYKKVPNPKSGQSQTVTELFYYGCSHCYDLEDSVHEWLETKPKSVTFERMPAVLDNPNWVFMAHVFYTAKMLGIEEAFHRPYFEAIHRDRKQVFSVEALAQFVKPMGIDPADYKAMFDSFQVKSAVSKARQATNDFGINGVPAMVINGQWLTDVPMAGSHENLWQVVDTLLKK
jgi:thiol:disulfide interchange protein DsbA